MRAEALRNLKTDSLQLRIKAATQELELMKAEMRRRIGEFQNTMAEGGTSRRNLTVTPLHREISRVTQELRHAINKKAPTATIKKLGTKKKRLQARLRSEKRKG
jgi:hypothetical protein